MAWTRLLARRWTVARRAKKRCVLYGFGSVQSRYGLDFPQFKLQVFDLIDANFQWGTTLQYLANRGWRETRRNRKGCTNRSNKQRLAVTMKKISRCDCAWNLRYSTWFCGKSRKLTGWPLWTIVGGKIAFADNKIQEEVRGSPVRYDWAKLLVMATIPAVANRGLVATQ